MSNSSVEEVRDRIIKLAREIEEFSRSDMPPRSFFHEFLRRVVGAVGARAGVVWLRNPANQLEMLSELNLDKTGFSANPNAPMINQKILVEVMGNGQACTYHPDDATVDLPTSDMLVLAALLQNKEVVGVVEIFQRADTPAQARPGFLQFVEQMSGYACRFLDRQASGEAETQVTVGQVAEDFEKFILQLHKSLDVREVAATAANDGRLLVGCDRLSVVVMDGRKGVVRAISGQESVNQRANLVRVMTRLARRVVATKEKMHYTGKVDHLAPKVEKALADFIQESGSRMVTVIPVFKPDPLIEKEDERARPKEKVRQVVGGLIVEQMSVSQPRPGVIEKAELIADHVGCAIFNAKTHNRLFLMPLWRGLGKCFRFLEGRNSLKAALVVLALAAVVLALVFVPWEYRVEGKGRLMPVVQKDVFAPWDGEVVDLLVDSNKTVEEGELLMRIHNPDLKAQLTAALGELKGKEALKSALIQRITTQNTGEQTSVEELNGQWRATEEEIKALKTQIQILQDRIAMLEVRAPIAGRVATFQLRQLLLNRPVRRGEVLLEIKNEDGPWRLELEVEEHRTGKVFDAQRDKGVTELPVEFVLATDSEKKVPGTLSLLSERTNASEDAGSVVIAFADFKMEDLPRKARIGAEVRAKISCGQRSLGYVLFGDVVEFFQKYFWL